MSAEQQGRRRTGRVIGVGVSVLRSVPSVVLLVAVLLTAGIALSRYLFGYTPAWSDTLVTTIALWAVLLVAATVTARGDHIHYEFLARRVPWLRRPIELLTDGLTICLGIALVVSGAGSIADLHASHAILPSGLPGWITTVVVPVAGVGLVLGSIVHLVRGGRSRTRPDLPPEVADALPPDLSEGKR
ncbi:MAG: TRAP transporter small permease subunit [Streptosporangiales bacterium]|nr:TRAP transporter small permease subunit [Streptosporangiales bacterium]